MPKLTTKFFMLDTVDWLTLFCSVSKVRSVDSDRQRSTAML